MQNTEWKQQKQSDSLNTVALSMFFLHVGPMLTVHVVEKCRSVTSFKKYKHFPNKKIEEDDDIWL